MGPQVLGISEIVPHRQHDGPAMVQSFTGTFIGPNGHLAAGRRGGQTQFFFKAGPGTARGVPPDDRRRRFSFPPNSGSVHCPPNFSNHLAF